MNQNARTNGNIRTQEGGTFVTTDGGSGWCSMLGTMAMSAGKWYWEALVNDDGDALTVYVGIAPHNDPYVPHNQTGYYLGNVETAGSMGWYLSDGSNKNQNGSWGNPARGDKIMFAYDADAGLMWFGVNGKWNDGANPALGTNSDWTSLPTTGLAPFAGVYNTTIKIDANFGQKPFKYAPPDGFQPINAANNRPVKVISRPDQYVGVTTYTGNGDAVSPRTVELPFAADLVWAKSRDRTSYHMLVDTVRGNNKVISSNDTDLERDPTSYFSGGGVASIDGKIISIESGSSNNSNLNTNNEDAVVWSWKAGGDKNTFNVDDVGYASAAAAGSVSYTHLTLPTILLV